jgi:hypothetical protein
MRALLSVRGLDTSNRRAGPLRVNDVVGAGASSRVTAQSRHSASRHQASFASRQPSEVREPPLAARDLPDLTWSVPTISVTDASVVPSDSPRRNTANRLSLVVRLNQGAMRLQSRDGAGLARRPVLFVPTTAFLLARHRLNLVRIKADPRAPVAAALVRAWSEAQPSFGRGG